MSELERVLEIQELDSAIDQITHRRERLPERAALNQITATVRATQSIHDSALAEIERSEARIEQLESAGTVRSTKRARLEQQLRSASSTREADALTHELDTLARERSTSDDEELELLDLVEQATARREQTATELDGLAADHSAADGALAEAEATLERERAELTERRGAVAAVVAPKMLERYEQLRRSFAGVAISRLANGRCGACHLDQSRAQLEALRTAGPDDVFECEQCGRLLVQG